jgi:pimeloyl-ACP methyl ester carboxylesterase
VSNARDTPGEPNGHGSREELRPEPTGRALRKLRVPALFLFGADDRLIPVERSVAAIRGVLAQSGHVDFTIQVFDHDDHGMHDASGAIDPRYLDAMRNWLAGRVRAQR